MIKTKKPSQPCLKHGREIYPDGAVCLEMICRHYGMEFNPSERGIIDWSSMEALKKAGEKLGLSPSEGLPTVSQLSRIHLPCILLWDETRFIVLRKVKNGIYHVYDPEKGRRWYSGRGLALHWTKSQSSDLERGFALIFSDPVPSRNSSI